MPAEGMRSMWPWRIRGPVWETCLNSRIPVLSTHSSVCYTYCHKQNLQTVSLKAEGKMYNSAKNSLVRLKQGPPKSSILFLRVIKQTPDMLKSRKRKDIFFYLPHLTPPQLSRMISPKSKVKLSLRNINFR